MAVVWDEWMLVACRLSLGTALHDNNDADLLWGSRGFDLRSERLSLSQTRETFGRDVSDLRAGLSPGLVPSFRKG